MKKFVIFMPYAYKNLPNDASRNKFLRNTFLETAKLTPKMIMEIYQTALLSVSVLPMHITQLVRQL